jgi:hypothetical protein
MPRGNDDMEKLIPMTHYVGLSEVEPVDASKRQVHLARYTNDKYQVRFITKFNNIEEESVTTIHLTHSALVLLAQAAAEMIVNMDEHTYPKSPQNAPPSAETLLTK